MSDESTRRGFGRGSRHDQQTRENISRNKRRFHERDGARREREREAMRLRPTDLVHFEGLGIVEERLLPLVALSGEEVALVLEAKGGEANITPQERILLDDLARLGVGMRAVMGLLLQG